jgi:hypothetical protein
VKLRSVATFASYGAVRAFALGSASQLHNYKKLPAIKCLALFTLFKFKAI